ncbi:MAG: lamin tail domain-containing protein [Gemmatimonadetes bacterium]|nr:lamin tail domain-containing protein [Gemmatimonadota bacterium]
MRPFIALVFFALAAPLSAQPGSVVISELMWPGSTASTADEWIELYNSSDATVDLAGWTLTYRSGAEDKVMFVFDAAEILPRQTFLIANYAADHKNSLLNVEPQRVDSAVSLPNTKLLLHLYDGDPQAGGQLIDVADDGRGAPFAGDSTSKSAMVRIAFDQPGDQRGGYARVHSRVSALGRGRSARARLGNEHFTDALGLSKRASIPIARIREQKAPTCG